MKAPNESDPVIGDTDDLDDVVLESAAAMRFDRPPPEAPMEAVALTVWDEPPDAAGHRIPPVLEDGEDNIANQLVGAGNDEADRERRMAAGRQLQE